MIGKDSQTRRIEDYKKALKSLHGERVEIHIYEHHPAERYELTARAGGLSIMAALEKAIAEAGMYSE